MPIPNGKVTLAIIGHKVDTLADQVTQHMQEDRALFKEIREALDGCDEYPGVRGRLDRLEQSSKARDKHFWAIYGALISGLAALAFTWLK